MKSMFHVMSTILWRSMDGDGEGVEVSVDGSQVLRSVAYVK